MITRRDGSQVTPFRPAAIDERFGRLVENMFEDMMAPLMGYPPAWYGTQEGITSPRLNVSETEQAYEIESDLPGVDKNDVKISVDGRRVSIEAEERQSQERKEGQNVVYAERGLRKYVRSFTLPTEVDDESAQARLENGVLKVSLPKKQASQVKKLTVQ